MFLTYPSSPESRPLGFDDLRLVAVSNSGELALLSFDGTLPVAGGTLSRVPMNGGAPSPVEQNVMSADWAPGRDQLAIVHAVEGHGAIRELPQTGLEYQWVRFFPDGRRMLSLASEPGQPLRLYVLDLDGRKPIAVTPPTVTRTAAVSPDGTQIALLTSNGKLMVYPSNGGSGRVVPTGGPLGPLLWSQDDWLYVQHLGASTQIPTRVSRFHLPTGRLEPWSELRVRTEPNR